MAGWRHRPEHPLPLDWEGEINQQGPSGPFPIAGLT
jgi:hypothetical protein